jgi:predicted TIM-barrel fold metal-dependent hydrolase
MIFDGHAYTFPSLKGTGGFQDPDQLRRHLQQAMATHPQPAWRLRDRAPGDNSGLIDLDDPSVLSALKEARFRTAGLGRFEWTVDGEDYGKQYFPPSIDDMAYAAEKLVAEMDYAGVDKALLHRTPYLGIGNDFIADCVAQFPDRLMGLAHIEEWRVAHEPEACLAELETAVRRQGLSGLHFLPPQLNLYGGRGPWDAPEFTPFWDGVADLGIPMFFSLKDREAPALESYMSELRTLSRWARRYPDVKVVMTHGLGWGHFMYAEGINFPPEAWEPFENPNLHLQFLFPIALGAIWDYPMPEVRPAIEECVRRIGADRIMWGTDMPIVMRFWTYRQNIDFIREYCDFLSKDELNAILGGTTARLLGVDSAPAGDA